MIDSIWPSFSCLEIHIRIVLTNNNNLILWIFIYIKNSLPKINPEIIPLLIKSSVYVNSTKIFTAAVNCQKFVFVKKNTQIWDFSLFPYSFLETVNVDEQNYTCNGLRTNLKYWNKTDETMDSIKLTKTVFEGRIPNSK